MRLWHKGFLSVLPRQQLVSQLRECILIAKNIHDLGKPNHILVNAIMNYPINHFIQYTYTVIGVMEKRGYKIRLETVKKFDDYLNVKFNGTVTEPELFKDWHNETYLDICFYNLFEKFKCGGIPDEEFQKIQDKYCDLKGWRNTICRIKVDKLDKYVKE